MEGNGAAFPVGVVAGKARTGGSALRPAPRPAIPTPPPAHRRERSVCCIHDAEARRGTAPASPALAVLRPEGASRSSSVGWWGNAMMQASERSEGRRTAPLTLRSEEPRKPFPSIPRPALVGASREARATVRRQPSRRAPGETGSPGETPREVGSASETRWVPLTRPRFHG